MSAKDYLRELREEIKSDTSKMLQETAPSTEPVPDEEEGDDDSSEPSAGSDPPLLSSDDNEADGGKIEFVELVSANKPPSKLEKENEEPPAAAGGSKANPTDPVKLKKEILKKHNAANRKLEKKREECRKLDEGQEGEESDGDGSCSVTSSVKSKNSSKKQQPAVVDPAVQKRFDAHSKKICNRIKAVQSKLQQLRISGAVSDNSSTVSSTSGTSSKVTTSSKAAAKNAKKNAAGNAAKQQNLNNIFTKNGSAAFFPNPAQPSTPISQLNLMANHRVQVGTSPLPSCIQGLAKPENLLLLTLLTLSPKQRDEYLLKLGKEKTLLTVRHQKGQSAEKKSVEINPNLQEFAVNLKSRAMVHLYGPQARVATQEEVSRPFLTVTAADKIQEVKKVREVRTFEEEVSYLLNNGKVTDKADYKKELTLQNVSKAERNGFLTEANQKALHELVDEVVKKELGYVVEGVVRVNVNNNSQAFVDDHTRDADVYINTVLLRKCAMDGDRVRVFVKHGEVQPEEDSEDSPVKSERLKNNWGFVIDILEKRHSRVCVGTFMPYYQSSNQYIKFSPRDLKIPVMRIYKQHWPEAIFKNDFKQLESVIYQAEIIEWHEDVPIGTILKSIGKCGELEAENQALLVEYDLDVSPYSEEIINSLPPSPFQIPEEELKKREDLREECVFTIDPLTARDLDDALSCKVLKNGNFEIGVHISDVSYFLKEGSELDELVKLRATSIYMVDNVYHMLPKPLCFLCSLLPGEDKLAFSVFWEITPDAKVLSTRFAKTVINSCTQLAYEHAQVMLDKPTENLRTDDFPPILHDYTPNYLSRIVNQLQSIAVQLRARRMENGCIKINQPKLSFTLDPNTGKPTSYAVYELRTANQMIEDFMLLANSSVAEFTYSKFKDLAILRNHFAPSSPQLTNLAKLLAKHGHTLRHDSSKAIAESFETISNACPQPEAARAVLNIMMAKPMTRALYFCSAFTKLPEDFFHYALAIPMYTHFTSPIRRYADCLVHRVLTAALDLSEPPARTPEELSQLANICNVKKYNAKLAGDSSSLLYFKHYLKKAKSIETTAAVSDIGQQLLELVLISTGHVCKVSYKQLAKVADFKLTEDTKPFRHCMLLPKDRKIAPAELRLFSEVRVTVQLVKEAVTVTSVLPSLQVQSKESTPAVGGEA
ncbi:exosome complex exonuclease RRP44 [Culex quinquefasciatus]|uniref:Exosome complex exonuclease RRP44 n=1 Tax=Culex quinquefasciatus TaxID=7176 RepID=B0X905_CULQU|nr:exosome complex exonuclease RRP44 [Culex quinquefasciatus]|eukprot:XP_001866127.1 exosome complex exonuclease RRP44 [Culex quinquefasciatus]